MEYFKGIEEEKGLRLTDVGVLAEAGCKVGDLLLSVAGVSLVHYLHREKALMLDFATPELVVWFDRKGKPIYGKIKNPNFKG